MHPDPCALIPAHCPLLGPLIREGVWGLCPQEIRFFCAVGASDGQNVQGALSQDLRL